MKKPGRKQTPPHLKREKMTGVRIPRWLLDFIMKQPGSSGKLVEDLLIEKFNLEKP